MLTRRTPEAHATALETFRTYKSNGMFHPPSAKGIIVFPGYDGGAEWGGPAFDPETGLLYVNSNEMAWLLRMMPRSDRSLYSNTARAATAMTARAAQTVPSLIDIAQRRTRDEMATIIRQGTGRMPAFADMLDTSRDQRSGELPVTGKTRSPTLRRRTRTG